MGGLPASYVCLNPIRWSRRGTAYVRSPYDPGSDGRARSNGGAAVAACHVPAGGRFRDPVRRIAGRCGGASAWRAGRRGPGRAEPARYAGPGDAGRAAARPPDAADCGADHHGRRRPGHVRDPGAGPGLSDQGVGALRPRFAQHPLCHRAQADRNGAGSRPAGGAGGQRREERIPGPHEPRNSQPAGGDPGLCRKPAGAADHAGRAPGSGRNGPPQQPAPAGDRQRHSGHLEDRIGPVRGRADRLLAGRPGGRRDQHAADPRPH